MQSSDHAFVSNILFGPFGLKGRVPKKNSKCKLFSKWGRLTSLHLDFFLGPFLKITDKAILLLYLQVWGSPKKNSVTSNM